MEIYKHKHTVFKLTDIAMLLPSANAKHLGDRMSYYVQTGRLLNPRKGIYAKPGYNPLELANRLYAPSYISLEYVLQKAGIIFQYDNRITCVSYLSREILVDETILSYRRMKEELIMDTAGVIQTDASINIATPERAFLDMLYLNKSYYFDNLDSLNKAQIDQIIPLYKSNALEKRVLKLIGNAGHQ